MTSKNWQLISCSMVVTLIGLISLLGWVLDHAALTSVIPAFSNMTLNTALCFTLLGLALLLPRSWLLMRLGCAIIIGLFATLMLVQLIFGINLGIDNLLYNHSTAYPYSPYPGRMATTTIVSFMFSSIALQLIIIGCQKKWSCYAVSILISATGIASLYGLIMNLVYTEVHVSLTYQMSMSLMTAMGFLATSITLWGHYKATCLSRISEDIFYPVIKLMFKLSFPRKFFLIAVVFSIPLVFSMQYTLDSLSRGMQQAQKDLSGTSFLRDATKLLLAAQKHRGMVNAGLHGNQSLTDTSMEQNMKEIQASILHLQNWNQANKSQWLKIEALDEIEKEWNFIVKNETTSNTSVLWQAHSRMIEHITQMMTQVGGKLSYNLEADLAFHNISDAAIDHLPQVMEGVGQIRGLGAGFLSRNNIGVIGKYRISNLSDQMQLQVQKTIAHLSDINETGLKRRTIRIQINKLEQAVSAFDAMTRNTFLRETNFSISAADYFHQGTRIIESAVGLQSIMLDDLSLALNDEIEYKHKQLYLAKSITAVSLLLITFLFLAFYRSIMLMIRSLAETAEHMKQGDMRKPELKTEDELGHVIHSFNSIAEELISVSANMQAIFNYAVDGIITINSTGDIAAINPSAGRIFGYDEEELVGVNITELMPEKYRAAHLAGLTAKASGGPSNILGKAIEIEGLHKDGTVFPIDLSVNEMKSPSGGIMFIGMVRDIKARKDREAENRRLATVVEQAVEAIVITDAKGIIQYINPAFVTLNGYSLEEAIGQTPGILKSGKEREGFYADLWTTIKDGGIWRAQLTNKRKDGTYYDAEHEISPVFDVSGKITNYVGFQRNVTAEKVLQSQMEHAQRLESLGVLAGGIAHDFNNILTAIMGNVALAERKLDPTSPAMNFLSRVEDSTQSAANLCKQMLAYSGKGNFEIKPLNLSDLVEDISRLMEVSIKKNVLLRYHIASSLPAIDADESQLQQVILNLITNANEAIEDRSGVISLTTGMMHASSEYLKKAFTKADLPEGRYVYLEVSDTGCGMDRTTLSRIFDPFYTTKFAGRGLGMSAVVGIINSHRGALMVYSEVDRGTTFKILLPASDKEALLKPEIMTNDHWQGHGTVLIVDDEDTIREVAAIILEEMGYETRCAQDGLDALEIYQHHQNEITFVLLDMTMPRMDGAKCFSKLREINSDVKVILSSGYSELDSTPDFLGKGLAGFIQKPYTPEAIQEKLQEIFKEDS